MNSVISTILAQDDGGGSALGLLIILIPMGAILYMTIVPQRKQRQRQADMMRRLDIGDEVLTNGGIVGIITHIEDELLHIEVDTDVVIRVAKNAIARNLAEPDPADKPAARSRRGLLGGGGAAASEADDTDTDTDTADTDGERGTK